MKRKFSVEKKIGTFSLNIDDLEKLCSRLREEFGDDDVSTSIYLNLPRGELILDSVDEIREGLPDCKSVNDFSIFFHPHSSSFYEKSLWITSPKSFGPFLIPATVNSSSDNETWSTGVCETAASYLKEHRTWYHWIIQGAVWWPFITILYYCILRIFSLWLPSMEWIYLTPLENPNLLTLLLPCTLLFVILLYIRGWLFPYGAILIRQKSHDTQKISAILSIIASISIIIYAFIDIIHKFIDMLN